MEPLSSRRGRGQAMLLQASDIHSSLDRWSRRRRLRRPLTGSGPPESLEQIVCCRSLPGPLRRRLLKTACSCLKCLTRSLPTRQAPFASPPSCVHVCRCRRRVETSSTCLLRTTRTRTRTRSLQTRDATFVRSSSRIHVWGSLRVLRTCPTRSPQRRHAPIACSPNGRRCSRPHRNLESSRTAGWSCSTNKQSN